MSKQYELRVTGRSDTSTNPLAAFDTYDAAMAAYDETIEGLDFIAKGRIQVWGRGGIGYCTGRRDRTESKR